MRNPLILVVEDNREIRLSARFILEDFGFEVAEAESPTQAQSWLLQQLPSLILLDMNFERDTTSGEEGLGFLRWLKQQDWDVPVIAMTAWSNTALVVQAMQLGAGDFIEKPWNNQRLLQVIRQQLQLQQLSLDNRALAQRVELNQPQLVWRSAAMNRLMEQLNAVASTDANILLTGENGTGKSQLAAWLHAKSHRAKQAFIAVNMGAIPESLFESEMFGHKKGAFTDAKESRVGRVELARGGSLFLDEIANLPTPQQAKLLRVLESGEFEVLGSSQTLRTDIRIISASNGNFETLISQGEFRRDLYYRLNTLEFRVPALRERLEDIPLLAACFLEQHGRRYRKNTLKLSDSVLAALVDYDWPGNVRELSHIMERAVLLARTAEINLSDIQLPTHKLAQGSVNNSLQSNAELPLMTLESAELALIKQAMSAAQGNKQHAADMLGITKSSLYRRLEKYGLPL